MTSVKGVVTDIDFTVSRYDNEAATRAGVQLAREMFSCFGITLPSDDEMTAAFQQNVWELIGLHGDDVRARAKTRAHAKFRQITRARPDAFHPPAAQWSYAARWATLFEAWIDPEDPKHINALVDIEEHMFAATAAVNGVYPDAVVALQELRFEMHVPVVGLTTSDVRLRKGANGVHPDFCPHHSTVLKQQRLRHQGVYAVVPEVIVAEHGKHAPHTWDEHVLPFFARHGMVELGTPPALLKVGDTIADMVDAEPYTRWRVFLARHAEDQWRIEAPAPATHLIRSLAELPALVRSL